MQLRKEDIKGEKGKEAGKKEERKKQGEGRKGKKSGRDSYRGE